MNDNEKKMKDRGAAKVWKTAMTKSGNSKTISSSQLGQQLLLEDALRIAPLVRTWIENDSGKSYRAELQSYFSDDEILLEKITQTFLYLSGTIYNQVGDNRESVSKTRHKKINTLRKMVMPDLSFDQTWRFLEITIHFSKYFFVEKLLNYKDSGFRWNLKYSSNLSEVMMESLAKDAAEAFYPLPMTEEPVPWEWDEESGIKGGYEDFQYEMVRASSKHIPYEKYSRHIFNSVNYIQSVPWVVNEVVLDQVKKDLVVPRKEDYIKSEYPDREPCRWNIDLGDPDLVMDEKKKKIIQNHRKLFREKVSLFNAEIGDYESALGKYRAVRLAVQIAEQYVGKTIYFPHSFDFRGRIYPLAIGLSPQGSDAVKALLLYKRVETVTSRGMQWNWAYLASLYGDDKLPFDERVERGRELLYVDYKEADEPYQFLSHQLELQKYIEHGITPNTRIHLDACNSGSQFTSAITGDRAGCMATNVIPTYDEDGNQVRQDAYMLVAEKSLDLCDSMYKQEKTSEKKKTIKFLKSLLDKDGRKICKVPVMVSNYGGTAGGRADILWDMLRELQVDRKWITKKVATLWAKIIGDSIVGVLNGGKAFETYIHQMNNVLAKNNKPITWTTSDGFFVSHVKNKELKAKQVNCLLPGARKKTTITKKVYSEDVSSTKMKSAISPNYIHSLDAELLRRVALKMMRSGIYDSDWIHDSFGCHPNHVDKMLEITKREFSKLVRRQPLKLLDKELRSQAPTDAKSKKALDSIKMPHLRGFNANTGDLDIVMESEWFFS